MDKKSKRRKEESWDREANRLAERRNRFIEKENEKKERPESSEPPEEDITGFKQRVKDHSSTHSCT